MNALTLISKNERPIRPIVEAALANELRLLESGILKTEEKLRAFEAKYKYSTQEFLEKYESDQLEETLDFDEWVGEYRMFTRLTEKAEALRGTSFVS